MFFINFSSLSTLTYLHNNSLIKLEFSVYLKFIYSKSCVLPRTILSTHLSKVILITIGMLVVLLLWTKGETMVFLGGPETDLHYVRGIQIICERAKSLTLNLFRCYI